MIEEFLGIPSSDTAPSQMWIASVVQNQLKGAADSRSYLIDEDGGDCLAELLSGNPKDYLGETFSGIYGDTPGFLLKLLNTRDRLLAQVHPDAKRAMKYFHSPFGKTECWYVIDTIPGENACIWAGFKPGVTRELWKKRIIEQDISGIMNCLHQFEIQKGDVILIPAGLPHAMGKNSLVAEIQEPVDLTLRAERFRPDGSELPEESLHSGIGYEGLVDCFDYDCAEKEEMRQRLFIKSEVRQVSGGTVTTLIGKPETSCFSMERIAVHPEAAEGLLRENRQFAAALVLDGIGWVEYLEEDGMKKRLPLKKGSELFFPHGLKEYRYLSDHEEGMIVLESMPPEVPLDQSLL